MFINDAMAQATSVAPQATGGSIIGSFGMLIIFILVFYFLVYKPQSDQLKKHKQLMDNLKKGDVVVCASGIVGKVVKMHSEQIVLVEISDEVIVRVEKDKIAEIIDKKHFVKLPEKAKKTTKK